MAGITAHTNTDNRSPNCNWRIVFWWGIDEAHLEGPEDLFANVTAAGNVIKTEYVTTNKLGMRMRYALAVQNGTGNAIERALVWAALAFRFRS